MNKALAFLPKYCGHGPVVMISIAISIAPQQALFILLLFLSARGFHLSACPIGHSLCRDQSECPIFGGYFFLFRGNGRFETNGFLLQVVQMQNYAVGHVLVGPSYCSDVASSSLGAF